MAVDELIPEPSGMRLPRRGDKVVAGAKTSNCVSGVVQAYTSRSLTIKTGTKHGLVHMDMARFTWSNRRRAWVCWSTEVLREVKSWERLDTYVKPSVSDFAAVGDYVLIGKRGGWVTKVLGQATPSDRAPGMIFNTVKGYLVSTADGSVELDRDGVAYDSERRLWMTREGA